MDFLIIIIPNLFSFTFHHPLSDLIPQFLIYDFCAAASWQSTFMGWRDYYVLCCSLTASFQLFIHSFIQLYCSPLSPSAIIVTLVSFSLTE